MMAVPVNPAQEGSGEGERIDPVAEKMGMPFP